MTCRALIACFVLLIAGGCRQPNTAVAPTSILPPTSLPTLPTPLPATATPVPDTGWQPVRAGMELRLLRLAEDSGSLRETLTLIRIDPAQYDLRVAYRPGAPQTLTEWQAETGALLIVNGGFFTPEHLATGLIIVDGVSSNRSYQGFGGMLSSGEAGIEVRSLAQQPYQPDETLEYALQAFPMLLVPGGELGYPEEDGQAARRTVVAQDRDGRLLFIFAPGGTFTLHQMSRFLLESDLELDAALNLDGGTSTGMLLTEPPVEVPAFALLPTVITITPRE